MNTILNKIMTAIVLLFVATAMQAQTTVKGTLTDSLTHEGEPYATVRIYVQKALQQTGAQPVSMTLTDTEGKFSTSVPTKGEYVAVCSSVGKNAVVRPFNTNGEKEIDLGTLLISDKESVMQSVEITAQKPIVKMEADKMTYSVEDDAESRTLTVLDMLRKVPMVMVDGQDNITVNGQSSYKVYVDGKPNMMLSANASQIFKAMPASMVSSIEVVTSPGAKYDAEGAGGILNICMAKMGAGGAAGAQSISGYNGAVTLTTGNRNQGIGANVSGQQKKLSYNADVSYNYVNNGKVNVDMLTKQLKDGSTTDYSLVTKNTVPIIMGEFGLGYELDSLSQMNMSFGVTSLNVTNKGNPTTKLYGGAYGEGFGYSNFTKNKIGNTSYMGSLDYQRFFDSSRQSSLTITYQTNNTPATNDSWTTGFRMLGVEGIAGILPSERMSLGKEMTMEHVGQVDLVNKIAAHSKLNSGVKYAFRKSTSDMDYYNVINGEEIYAEDMSTDYEHRNQIGAAYVESENAWDTWSLKAGLRYEHTWQNVIYHLGNGESFKKNYGNLVPSFAASYTLKPGQSLGLTYNMRISRPGISYLNPYVNRTEPTSISYGNPNLEVEKNHKVALSYNLYTPKLVLSTSLSETITKGGIEQYSFYNYDEVAKQEVLHSTYGNIVDRQQTALDVFAQWSMTKTTRVVMKAGAMYSHLHSAELEQCNSGFGANAMLNIQQTLPKSWTVGMTFVTNSKSKTLQGYTSGYNLGVLTLSKSLLKDRLSLSLNAVTGLSKGGKLLINSYSEGKDFTNKMNISVPVTRVALTAIWSFGNTNKRFQKHETNVTDDYIEHKSNTESIGSAGKM